MSYFSNRQADLEADQAEGYRLPALQHVAELAAAGTDPDELRALNAEGWVFGDGARVTLLPEDLEAALLERDCAA